MEWSEFIFHKEEEKDVREENVGEIEGASGGGAKFAENGNDEIVRQGIERVTLSGDIRRIPASFPVTNLFGGEISPSLSRVTKPAPSSHISLNSLSLSLSLSI